MRSRTVCHLLDLPVWELILYKWLLGINQITGLVFLLKTCMKVFAVTIACKLCSLTIIVERFDKAGADPMHGILPSSYSCRDILIKCRGDTYLPNQSTEGVLQHDQRYDIQRPASQIL